MIEPEQYRQTKAGLWEGLAAMLAGFGFACATFFFSAIVLLPITATRAAHWSVPDLITAAVIFFELFGLTSIAAIAGVTGVAQQIKSTKRNI